MTTIYTVRDLMGEIVYEGNDANECNRIFMAQLAGIGFVDRVEVPDASDAPVSTGPDDPVASDAALVEALTIMADADDDTRSIGYMSDGPDDMDVEDVEAEADEEDDDLMLHVDAASAGGTDPVEEAPVSPIATVLQVSSEGVAADMAQVRRTQLALDLEAALGLTMGPDVHGAGVVMGEIGVKRFHASYDEWAKRPDFSDACGTVAARIVAEDRKAFTVHGASLRMMDDGLLTMGGDGLRMEEAGFRMLLSQVARGTTLKWSRFFGGEDIRLVFPRAYQLMAVMPPDLRATVWNRMVEDASKGQRLMLLTRQPAGQDKRSLYATASETYGRFDGDRVLALLGRVLQGSGARGAIVYDPRSTTLYANASWHADRVFDVATGDVMGLSVSFRSNDARGGAITAHASAECGIGRATFGAQLCAVRHVGSGVSARASNAIREAVARARVAFSAFLSDWGHMGAAGIGDAALYGEIHDTVIGVVETMIKKGVIEVPGMDDEGITACVTRAWHGLGVAGSAPTMGHVARCLMAASKDGSLTPEQMDAMERAAGAFVGVAAKAVK
jgi:hypothetical protein